MNEADAYRVRVSAAVLRTPGEVLVVRESKRALAVVNLPGGAPQLGETLEHAVVREVREETGYDIVTSEIAFVMERRSRRWEDSTLEICFYAQIVAPTGCAPTSHDEVLTVDWLPFEHPDVLRHLPHARLFESSKRGRYVDRTSRSRSDAAV
ncbi:MAG TPA: NUDIX hydrolase [Candidatus Acidoferrales bacterium]|nr:NUDIX hydrolase [Candidatus Acidoferrales bacterium]